MRSASPVNRSTKMTRLLWTILGIVFAVSVCPTLFGVALSIWDTWVRDEYALDAIIPAIQKTIAP